MGGGADGTASIGTGHGPRTDGGQPPLSGGGAVAVSHGIAVMSRCERDRPAYCGNGNRIVRRFRPFLHPVGAEGAS